MQTPGTTEGLHGLSEDPQSQVNKFIAKFSWQTDVTSYLKK